MKGSREEERANGLSNGRIIEFPLFFVRKLFVPIPSLSRFCVEFSMTDIVHAIWACNAGTELSCIKNLEEHVMLQQMPLLPYILNGYSSHYYV